MQNRVTIFRDIDTLLTLEGAAFKEGRRVTEADLTIVKDAILVCGADGNVVWAGPRAQFSRDKITGSALPTAATTTFGWSSTEEVSLGHATVLPAFIECHTHTVFAGSRAHEFEWRQQGQTYQEISAKGGGILSTVKATRAASFDDLLKAAQTRVNEFVRQGVTLLETKTGYGLDLETEIKLLKVARALRGPKIVSTYLGAHSRSPDHPDLAAYMRFMTDTVLPRIAGEKLADRVDIYIEKGFYDLDLARTYLEKARGFGLPVTAHVEQLSDSGGTELALSFNPQSVDHVVYLNDTAIAKVAKSETTAVLLPASDFYLKMRYPPARALIDQGARVAISTDFNPGTSPTQDLSLVGLLGRLEMKMSLAEVISAYTVGAAHALGAQNEAGSLVQGKRCDFTVLDCDFPGLFYSAGNNHVRATFSGGNNLLNP